MYMRTELFSVRQSTEELSLLNRELKKIVTDLDEKASLRVLFKTEIDCNPKKIKKDLISSLVSDNPPELYIYANALDTKDSSSFRRLFEPVLKKLEKALDTKEVAEDGKTRLYPHIKVYPIEGLPGDYPGYCFIVENKKVIVLPRTSLVKADLSEYLCTAVLCAKEIFSKAFTDCPDGYVLLSKEQIANLTLMHTAADTDSAADEAETAENYTAENITPEDPADSTEAYAEPEKENATEDANDAEDTDTSENSDSPDGRDKNKKSGAKAFFRSFIPMKGDAPKAIAMKVVVLAAIAAFLVAIGMLLNFYVFEPLKNNTDLNEIQDIFYGDNTPATDASGDEIPGTEGSKNWAGLQKINKEIVGWIKIDNTEIDFPVLFHKEDNQDSEFYLYRNYKKEPSDFGSIFVDYRCTKGTDSRQVILHGHNMSSDGSMFTTLLDYTRKDGWTQGNIKYYQSAPIISFDTPKGDQDYLIFAIMKINVSNTNEAIFNYLMGEFESDAQYMNFIYNIKERSYINVNVPINENDRLLTLSTCSYEQENTRTVVVARQIREDENVKKYIKSAKQQTPLKDVTTAFSSEYAKGNIKWYDGDGKLEGDESLNYMEKADMYTVKFVDANGKTIGQPQKVLKGEDATAPTGEAPRKAADGTYYYTFKGWSPSFKNVTKNLTVKPVFNKHRMPKVETTTRPTDPPEKETQAPVTQKPTQAPTPTTTKAPVTNPPTTTAKVTDPPETTIAP